MAFNTVAMAVQHPVAGRTAAQQDSVGGTTDRVELNLQKASTDFWLSVCANLLFCLVLCR